MRFKSGFLITSLMTETSVLIWKLYYKRLCKKWSFIVVKETVNDTRLLLGGNVLDNKQYRNTTLLWYFGRPFMSSRQEEFTVSWFKQDV